MELASSRTGRWRGDVVRIATKRIASRTVRAATAAFVWKSMRA
jgi:hypothetical protein